MLLAIRGGAFFDFWPQVTSVVSLNRGLTGRFEVTASNDLGCWFEVAASNDLGGRFEVAALNGLKWAWWSYHPSNWGKLRFSCNFWPRMASEDGSEDLAEQVLNAVQTSKKASFHDFLAPQIAQISWRPRRLITEPCVRWGYMQSFNLLAFKLRPWWGNKAKDRLCFSFWFL